MLVVIVTDNGFAAEAIRRSFRGTSGVRVAGYVDGRRPCGAAVAEAGADVVIVDEMTWSANAVARISEVRRAVPACKIIVAHRRSPTPPGSATRCAPARTPRSPRRCSRRRSACSSARSGRGTSTTPSRPAGRPAPCDGDHGKLTPRELEILQLVAGGASNGVIARQLWVTEQTVKFHLSNVYRKLGVANRTAASHYAHVHGLADLGRPAVEHSGDDPLPFAA